MRRRRATRDETGIKLSGVLSDVMGVSGRAIVTALCAGERDPERLASLVHKSVAHKHAQLVEAARGRPAPAAPVSLVLPLDMVDKSIPLCKPTSGRFFHHGADRRGHLLLERGSIRLLLLAFHHSLHAT